MKLVDINDLSKLVGEPFEKFLSRLDLVCPEPIEAIPIEWLEQLLDDAELAGQPYTINILKRILSRWEEENGLLCN